ncbi:amino acid permease [Dongia mobilis]|uniref:amino acid permease n=1 Tax=Dongia sp. TaxID=1977262 RepID=UPI0026EB21CE
MAVPSHHDEDVKVLHSMGYSQELSRRMGGFQNFAISFSIICILAGGIGAYTVAFGAAGGGSIAIGWIVGSVFALLVAAAMGQIASAYPTAGGLYHWGSILGGKGWGWATAWLNLLGLLFVVSSVNYGVYLLLKDLVLVGVLGMNPEDFTGTHLIIAVAIITFTQAVLNYVGIKATTILTDFSGYLIMVVSFVLIAGLLFGSPVELDFSRLVTFTNNTGPAGAETWPATGSLLFAFILGLLHVCYTITGFDASAHTSEETRDAQRAVPKGMLTAVFWSAVFGWLLVVSVLLAMPDMTEGASKGWSVFFYVLDSSLMPDIVKDFLAIGIVLANYLCALAGMTSLSRMIYAFARDGGIPGCSKFLRQVSPKYRTPGAAIWVGAALCFVLGLVAGNDANAYIILASGCAVFLYVSYIMPIGAGLLAEGKSWTKKGPFNLGVWSKPIALLAVLGGAVLAFVGFQPPYQLVGYFLAGAVVLLIVIWFAFEKSRFPGPPLTEADVKARQAEIAREEAALGGAG